MLINVATPYERHELREVGLRGAFPDTELIVRLHLEPLRGEEGKPWVGDIERVYRVWQPLFASADGKRTESAETVGLLTATWALGG